MIDSPTAKRSALHLAAGSGSVRTLDLCLHRWTPLRPAARGQLGELSLSRTEAFRAAQSRTELFARAAEFLNLPPPLPCVDQL
jgi:hypothetical protein